MRAGSVASRSFRTADETIDSQGQFMVRTSETRDVRTPSVSARGTKVPRHLAGLLDNLIALVVSFICARQLPEHWIVLQAVVIVIVYLAYYFFFEHFFSATPAKAIYGLTIRSADGERCSVRQILIRTLYRLLEVNPMLLGCLPAAFSILRSPHSQRYGDKRANTVVIFR
jgi:uncharacterized RDD family membrane protein YckC